MPSLDTLMYFARGLPSALGSFHPVQTELQSTHQSIDALPSVPRWKSQT